MTANNKNLLIELFVEELPPKALKKLGDAFAQGLVDSLKAQGLAGADSRATPFASPRRLALHLSDVAPQAADRAVQQKLMPVAVALDKDGNATPALLKKLAALGFDASVLPQLKRAPDGKAEALFLDSVQAGATLEQGVQKALDESLAKLPIPKVMTYQLADGWSDVKFVRPAHGLLALHGSELLGVRVLGLTAGRETRGHRFESQLERLSIDNADSYATQLREQGAVIASYDERAREVLRQLRAASAKVGAKLDFDESLLTDAEAIEVMLLNPLLNEVTALVERPNVLICQFEPEFLAVPQECLILTMKTNQKYFPLLDAVGKLTNYFLVVSNISPIDATAVVSGNERVVRPRLSDAKFFFDQDRKKTLASRVAGLDRVVYHGKLGSQGDRVQRVRQIAKSIAEVFSRDVWPGIDSSEFIHIVDQSALLAKADLLTDMVGEFPELQGTMGRYYAESEELNPLIGAGIEDHYKPRFAGDELPRNDSGRVVALADKLETLVGMFGIGQLPTGDKDPFALRRHALGVIRILSEGSFGVNLRLDALIAAAVPAFGELIQNPAAPLADFIFDRLSGALREQGFSAQEVDAVLALRPQRLGDVSQRLIAVRAFAALPEAASLAAANKRIGNILKKSADGDTALQATVNAALLLEPAEQDLAAALKTVQPVADGLFARGEYAASLRELASLKAPVDAFFDGVMVNAEDAALRANRLSLLKHLHEAMNRVADLARLA